jgi:hypothetical protein
MSKMVLLLIVLIVVLPSTGFSQVQPAKPPEEPQSPLAVPKDYHYSGRGRRDPFVNPVPKSAPGARTAAGAPRPPDCPQALGLKGVLVGQAAIAGVVTAREPSMTVAVISAPGGKTYFARVGDALCDAVVKNIKIDVVTFLPNTPPGSDSRSVRNIDRKVRPAPGDGK